MEEIGIDLKIQVSLSPWNEDKELTSIGSLDRAANQ